MKTTTRNALVVVSAAALVGVTATAQAINTPPAQTTAATFVAAADLDPGLVENLQLTREEERMARDLYAALADVHDGARPMSRITNSEQQHFDRVGALLEQYGIDDPSADLAAGTYAFPALQELYDDWLAEGRESVEAAFQVGIDLEQQDIAGLEEMIAETSQDDVREVLSRLLSASENHLAALTRAADGTLPTEPGQGMRSGPGMQNREPGQGPAQGQRQGKGPGQGRGQGQSMAPGQGRHDCYLTDDRDDTSSETDVR